MAKELISKIQIRRDTAANWETNNTVLSKGEIALSYDVNADGVALPSSYRIKLGDGTTKWNSLDYFAQRVLVGKVKPTASVGEKGQFYIDTTNKYLYFNNGDANDPWIAIGGDISAVVTSIGGATGAITLDAGLSMVDNKLSAQEILDMAGQAAELANDALTKANTAQTTANNALTAAGTKLDKNTTSYFSVYGVTGAGDQTMFPIVGAGIYTSGIVGVDASNKIPVDLLPDVVLGNVLYGGNLPSAPTDANTWEATISASLKTRMGIILPTTSITIKNQEAFTPTMGYGAAYGWKVLEGVYFIANAKGTFAGLDFEVGDWLISTGSSWEKVDNTDAIKTVGGVAPDNGNVVVEGVKGVSVAGADSKLSIGLKLANEAPLSGGATTIAEAGAQVSAVRLDKSGNLGVVIPKSVEYSAGNNITISDSGAIGTVTGPTFSTVKVKLVTEGETREAQYGATGVTWGTNGNYSGHINLPSATGTQTFALLSDLDDKQDKLSAGKNITITGRRIQTTAELDVTKVHNSEGTLVVGDGGAVDVGDGSHFVAIKASGMSLNSQSAVNIDTRTVTISAQIGGVSVIGDVEMSDNLSVSGAITTASNNTGSTTLKEVIVDTDYVILDGGDSTTTW